MESLIKKHEIELNEAEATKREISAKKNELEICLVALDSEIATLKELRAATEIALNKELEAKKESMLKLERNYEEKLAKKDSELAQAHKDLKAEKDLVAKQQEILGNNENTYVSELNKLHNELNKANEVACSTKALLDAERNTVSAMQQENQQVIANMTNERQNYQLNLNQLNEQINQLNNSLESERNRHKSEINLAQARYKEYEDNIQSLKLNLQEQKQEKAIEVAQLKELLAAIQREANTYNQETNRLSKINADAELAHRQLQIEYKQLQQTNIKNQDESQRKLNNMQDYINVLEKSFREISANLKNKEAQNAVTQKRLREEIGNKNNELQSVRADLNKMVEKEEANKKQIEELKNTNEELKSKNIKLNADNQEIQTLMRKQTEQINGIKDYSRKFEEHYQQRKQTFEQSERDKKQLQNMVDSLEKNIAEYQEQQRILIQDLNCYKEKTKTAMFEAQQLKLQKDDLTKRINEMPVFDSSRIGSVDNTIPYSAKVKHTKFNTLSTPKRKCMDDSFVKYSSPELSSNPMRQSTAIPDELSRRFSIDSVATKTIGGSATISNSTISSGNAIMTSFNRFNTISESEFEEPHLNQKFLMQPPSALPSLSASTNDLTADPNKRLSILQIRNQQAKPHLKSSYPLEIALPAVNESQIRGDKENNRVYSKKISSFTYKLFILNLHFNLRYQI
jgi:hypothetical protein